eukprot:TRINITY_DN1978_c0_g1_i2.p1 TRINITY_DN1978_c0_g1~~TRINITY_DN1978_c0_g1_i2.p1  ORF type:complete len:153 (-),score=9.56 TRINITY_DN1978_c0_g1_i2:353-811(-)
MTGMFAFTHCELASNRYNCESVMKHNRLIRSMIDIVINFLLMLRVSSVNEMDLNAMDHIQGTLTLLMPSRSMSSGWLMRSINGGSAWTEVITSTNTNVGLQRKQSRSGVTHPRMQKRPHFTLCHITNTSRTGKFFKRKDEGWGPSEPILKNH